MIPRGTKRFSSGAGEDFAAVAAASAYCRLLRLQGRDRLAGFYRFANGCGDLCDGRQVLGHGFEVGGRHVGVQGQAGSQGQQMGHGVGRRVRNQQAVDLVCQQALPAAQVLYGQRGEAAHQRPESVLEEHDGVLEDSGGGGGCSRRCRREGGGIGFEADDAR